MPKKMLTLFVFIFLLGGTCYAGGHEQSEHLKVMRRNMDAGSDFGFVLAAAGNPSSTQVQLLIAITQTYQDVQLPAFDAAYNLIMVGLTDYDAVLARIERPTREFKIKKIDAQHFTNYLTFPVAGQGIPFLRGWISVDLVLKGREYRFVTTHLETFSPNYQAAQTGELLGGPLAVEHPVVLAGDLNSDAYTPSWERGPAFTILAGAGFVDVWDQKNPKNPGLTWPLFAEDPSGPATPNQRIDLVLTRGEDLRVKNIHRTGLEPGFNGLWTSDHAGVVASFSLQEECDRK